MLSAGSPTNKSAAQTWKKKKRKSSSHAHLDFDYPQATFSTCCALHLILQPSAATSYKMEVGMGLDLSLHLTQNCFRKRERKRRNHCFASPDTNKTSDLCFAGRGAHDSESGSGTVTLETVDVMLQSQHSPLLAGCTQLHQQTRLTLQYSSVYTGFKAVGGRKWDQDLNPRGQRRLPRSKAANVMAPVWPLQAQDHTFQFFLFALCSRHNIVCQRLSLPPSLPLPSPDSAVCRVHCESETWPGCRPRTEREKIDYTRAERTHAVKKHLRNIHSDICSKGCKYFHSQTC